MNVLSSRTEARAPRKIQKAPDKITFPYNFKKRKFEIQDDLPEMSNKSPSTQEIMEYLAEVESHLVQWHNASGRKALIIAIGILLILTLIFVFAVVDAVTVVYRLEVKWFVAGFMIFFMLISRYVILTVYKRNRENISIQIVQHLHNNRDGDLNKTAACVSTKKDYTWRFPENFPESIQLCKRKRKRIMNPEEEVVEHIEEILVEIQ